MKAKLPQSIAECLSCILDKDRDHIHEDRGHRGHRCSDRCGSHCSGRHYYDCRGRDFHQLRCYSQDRKDCHTNHLLYHNQTSLQSVNRHNLSRGCQHRDNSALTCMLEHNLRLRSNSNLRSRHSSSNRSRSCRNSNSNRPNNMVSNSSSHHLKYSGHDHFLKCGNDLHGIYNYQGWYC